MTNLEKLLQSLLKGKDRLAFLVGAGISIPSPSNALSGRRFNEEIISKISPDKKTKEELLILCNSERKGRANKGDFIRFEGLMQILQGNVDADLDILNYLGALERPNENHYLFARLIENGHYVFTTNFDALIEKACLELGIDCSALINDEDFRKYLRQRQQHPLLKLHGSLKRFDGKQWIDTKDSIKATLRTLGKSGEEMRQEYGKRKILTEVLQNHDLIIVGYSGYDDFDIVPLLKSIESDRKLIWINHDDKRERARRQKWHDLAMAKEKRYNSTIDKYGDFLRKREEVLYEVGAEFLGRRKRYPTQIFLFDMDTNRLCSLLKKEYGIDVPEIGEETSKEKRMREKQIKQYFNEWEKDRIKNSWVKAFVCGHLMGSIGRYEQALEKHQKGLEAAQKEDDKLATAGALSEIGIILVEKGAYDSALEKLEESLRICEEMNNKTGISIALHEIGIIYQMRGEDAEALKRFQKSIQMSEEGFDKEYNIYRVLYHVGLLYRGRGEYTQALACAERSFKIAERVGDIQGSSISLLQIGTIHREKGSYKRTLKVFEDHKRRSDISKALMSIGAVSQEMKEYTEAEKSYKQSLEIAEEVGNKKDIAMARAKLGRLYYDQNQPEEAINYLYRASLIFRELVSPYFEMAKADLKYIKKRIGKQKYNEILNKVRKM